MNALAFPRSMRLAPPASTIFFTEVGYAPHPSEEDQQDHCLLHAEQPARHSRPLKLSATHAQVDPLPAPRYLGCYR